MLPTGFHTFHFVSFLYVFFLFFSFSFVSFLFSLFCFRFFAFRFFAFLFVTFLLVFFSFFFLSVSFRFFLFFSVSQFTGTPKNMTRLKNRASNAISWLPEWWDQIFMQQSTFFFNWRIRVRQPTRNWQICLNFQKTYMVSMVFWHN